MRSNIQYPKVRFELLFVFSYWNRRNSIGDKRLEVIHHAKAVCKLCGNKVEIIATQGQDIVHTIKTTAEEHICPAITNNIAKIPPDVRIGRHKERHTWFARVV